MKTATKVALLLRPRGSTPVPLTISGLKLWVDTNQPMYQNSNGTTAAGNGDPVGYLPDLSGNGNHLIQATTAAKPTLRTVLGPGGARPAVEFDGIDDRMTVLFTLAQPATVFMVINQVTWASLDQFIDGGVDTAMTILQSSISPNIRLYAGVLGNEVTAFPLGTFGVITALFSGAVSMLRINTGTKNITNAGVLSPGGLTLGARQNGSRFANFRVSELLVYDRDLSASSEDAAVISYLNSKWSVF